MYFCSPLTIFQCFEPLTLSLTHPVTYKPMRSLTYTKRKSTSLTVDPSFFLPPSDPTCLFAFPPTSLKVSHTFPCFWKGGPFPLAVLFDNMGHWCCFSRNTQTPVHVCFDRSTLRHWRGLPWGTAQTSVSNPDSSQTHTHIRMNGWTSVRRRPWTLFTGWWLTSQQKAIRSLPTHR